MWIVDGSRGEGGGQIFRSSLTLALCLGKPVRIENIRAGRAKPGLLRQHLTCLKAAAEISGGRITGGELRSQTVTFEPGEVKPGDYHFAVGSAGSASLVFQTIWLPLALNLGESGITVEGGTHNGMAPSFDFIAQAFLPVMRALGWQLNIELLRFGFYPAGGGAWVGHIQGVDSSLLRSLELSRRDELMNCIVVSTGANIAERVMTRELECVKRLADWPNARFETRTVQARGHGNILSVRLEFAGFTSVFEVVGEKRKSAEKVAGEAVKMVQQYIEHGAPVCEYLADQLILPLVLGGGGSFVTGKLSQHTTTNIEVVRELTGCHIEVKAIDGGCNRVSVDSLFRE